MQNEIVKVNFDTQTVSARELHEQLHIGTEFAKWFSRMCEYDFQQEMTIQRLSSKMTKT